MIMDIGGVILKFEYTAVMPKTKRCGNMLNTHAITFNRISTLDDTRYGYPSGDRGSVGYLVDVVHAVQDRAQVGVRPIRPAQVRHDDGRKRRGRIRHDEQIRRPRDRH